VRPLTPHGGKPVRPQQPSGPIRPPAPGMRVDSLVPAQAPKPSLDPTDVADVPTPLATPTPQPVASVSDTSGLDQIVGGDDDDLVAVPAPSEEMLMSAAARHMRAPRLPTKTRSATLQRTLIPILLTLGVLLPGFGIWLLVHPAESELHLYGQRLLIYLCIAGAVFLILAIVNMFQVRGALRALRAGAIR